MKAPIRLVLADDQALFLEGLRTLLSLDGSLEIVAECVDGQEALQACRTKRPQVVLMDLNMPVMDGVVATRKIKQELPSIQILMLTTFDDDDRVFEALRAGASGYLLKDTPSKQLVDAIHAVSSGESFLQPSIASKVLAEFNRLAKNQGAKPVVQLREALSIREEEVLRWLARGFSNKEIAAQLELAEGTVKNHVSNLLGKMGVLDRTQAALLRAISAWRRRERPIIATIEERRRPACTIGVPPNRFLCGTLARRQSRHARRMCPYQM